MQNASMPTNIARLTPTVSAQNHFCPERSPSISEFAVGDFDPNDSIVSSAFEALKSCRVAADGVTAACRAVHADTTLSEGARHVSAADVAHKVVSRPLPLVDSAGSKVSAEITRIETRIKAPAVSTGIREVHVAHEIRATLRTMTDTNRRKEISKSLSSGDDTVLSAIMSAPPMLTGLSQPDVDGYALMWRQKRFPGELSRLAQLEKVAKAVYLAGQLLISHGQAMASPAIVASAKAFQKTTADAIKAATGAQ